MTPSRAPITERLAAFISSFTPAMLPEDVSAYTQVLIYDGVGTLAGATHPSVTASAGIAAVAEAQGGAGQATLIGRATRVDVVNAVLANATLGYACDFEPHHPAAILHPIAVMVPTALAISELKRGRGDALVAAVALGCEVTYRVSMSMDPKALYHRGFHPSAVCGVFGAAAAAAFLLRLNRDQTVRALGLAALQASGLMAWEDDPREDARPFQMGMAARNGVSAALLAARGFGGPDRIFDGGHNVLHAFSDAADPTPLTAALGRAWTGVTDLAIKPYPCVSFLHPALDALGALIRTHALAPGDIRSITLRFAASGSHCLDDNPLKGHSAHYILPVRTARGGLDFLDLFEDRRETDAEVARLAAQTSVVRDTGALEDRFPDAYIGEVTLTCFDGSTVTGRSEIARGYRAEPLSDAELDGKFDRVVGAVASPARTAALRVAARGIFDAKTVDDLAGLLAVKPETDP